MTTLNATEARSTLYSLIDKTAETHQPIVIKGKTPYYCPKRTGMPLMKLSFYYQFPA